LSVGFSLLQGTAFLYLKGPYKKDGDKLSSRACCNRTKGNGFKLKEGRFRLDIRMKIFTMRVVKPWYRLPREVGDAPSLETFKPRLDRAPSNPIQVKMSLLMAGGWTGWSGNVSPTPNHSMVLWCHDLMLL